MNISRAALRYAKALLLEADQQILTEVVQEDMQSVYATLMANKDLRLALASPIIKGKDKKAILTELFGKQTEISKGLIEILIQNKRANLLQDIAKAYINLYNRRQGIKEVVVITATELTPEVEKNVLKKAKELTHANQILLTSKINPDLIGGFIIRVDDVEYNASIVNQLKTIKKEFSKSL